MAIPVVVVVFGIVTALIRPAIRAARDAASEAVAENEEAGLNENERSMRNPTEADVEPPPQPVRQALLKQHIDAANESTRRFSSVLALLREIHSLEDAQRLKQQLDTELQALAAAGQAGSRLPKLGPAEQRAFNARTSNGMETALTGMRAESVRIQAIPGLQPFGIRFQNAAAGGLRALQAARDNPPRDADLVVVTITNVPNQTASDILGSKMGSIADNAKPTQTFTTVDFQRKVMTVRIGPVADPKQIASRITWGKVTKVAGRKVTIKADPPAAEEVAAWRAEHQRVETSRQEEEAARRNAGAAVDLAAKKLASANPNDQRDGLNLLGRVDANAPEAVRQRAAKIVEPYLQHIMDSGDRFVRSDAAKRLAEIGGPENVPTLLRFLEVEDFFGGGEVVNTLVRSKDPRAAKIFGASFPRDRDNMAKALIALGPVAEPEVLPHLTNPDGGTRNKACEVLRVIGTKASIAPLQGLLVDRDQSVTRNAEAAIAAIEEREGNGAAGGSPMERIASRRIDATLQLLSDPATATDRDKFFAALEAVDRLPKDTPRKPEIARSLVGLLFNTPDDGMKGDVVRRLQNWANPDVAPDLARFIERENAPMFREVIDLVRDLKDPSAAGAIAKNLVADRERAANALVALGEKAEGAVIPYLDHQDPGIRTKACEILRGIGTKNALRPLTRLTRDPNGDVARNAEAAFQAIQERR